VSPDLKGAMNRPFSVYLDLVRFTAACLVYLWHSNMRLLTDGFLPASGYGHSSVIVFFVLSGFVIAYVTDTKEKNWVDYSASRLSRLGSVVIPTLLLTPLLDAAGRALYPALYDPFPWDRFGLRLAGSGLMMNESWFISITFFSNVPYWSIAFEFWYYVLFALVMFVPAPWRWPAVLAVCALVGPKIVLLAPIWWAGVLLYRWRWPRSWSVPLSWFIAIGSTAAIFLTHALGFYETTAELTKRALGEPWFTELTFARFALGDYVLGLLVFLQFAAVRNVSGQLAPLLLRIEKPVRWLAGYTFTLYLLHQPLFLFWTAVLQRDPHGYGFWWFVTALTAVSVVAIGSVTEQRRQWLRDQLRGFFLRLQQRFEVSPGQARA
jgi:peptidoglycan/LPS O-acetylase OafA/YrhL